jgi:hypothetical protein
LGLVDWWAQIFTHFPSLGLLDCKFIKFLHPSPQGGSIVVSETQLGASKTKVFPSSMEGRVKIGKFATRFEVYQQWLLGTSHLHPGPA